MIPNVGRGWYVAVFFVLTFVISHTSHVQASVPAPSIIDLGMGRGDVHENELATILTYRDISEHPVLQKANSIIKTKLAGSTPLQEAAIRLYKACKTAKDRADSFISADDIKEMAKQIYSIKATDVSLATAGLKSPKACDLFCGRAPSSWFGTGSSSSRDINDSSDPAVARDRSICLRELYKVDNSWTSYSNHLQDANSLCEVPSVEHASHILLELLKDFTEAVPPMFELFKQQMEEQQQIVVQQRQHAEELFELSRTHIQEMEDQHRSHKEMTEEVWHDAQSHASDITNQLRTDLQAAGGVVSEMQKAAKQAVDGVLGQIEAQNRFIEEFRLQTADATALQLRGVTTVEDKMMGIIRATDHLYGGLGEQIEALSTAVRTKMTGLMDGHTAIMHGQIELMALQNQSRYEAHEERRETSDEMFRMHSVAKSTNVELQGISRIVNVLAELGVWRFYALLAIAGLTGLMKAIGFNWHAEIIAYTGVLFVGLSYLVPASERLSTYLWSDRTTVMYSSGASKSFLSFAEMPHSWLVLAAAFAVLILVVKAATWLRCSGESRSKECPEELGPTRLRPKPKKDRAKRAETAAPDYRPGYGFDQPTISMTKILIDQQRLNLQMKRLRRSAV